MAGKVRHQLFLSSELSERLEALAAKPGVTKSAILARALGDWIERQGTSELDKRFAQRLDRIGDLLERLLRDSHIELETLALFVRYVLTIHPPLADSDVAGRAAGAKRFEAFQTQVARQIAGGSRSLEKGRGQ